MRVALAPTAASALVALVVLLPCCSDNGGQAGPDGARDGAGGDATRNLPPDYKPWDCNNPGEACNAHDSCAINPVCGADLKCWPQALLDCDDGLDCTTDTCAGMGVCEHTAKEGMCALSVQVAVSADAGVEADAGVSSATVRRCFAEGERDPDDACMVCDPARSTDSWTAANGGKCDDGNPCTKDDTCLDGICGGVHYGDQCLDAYTCTDDLCDGAGGCLGNPLRSTSCLIDGVCYDDGTMHPDGTCYACDVSQSQDEWTALQDTCTIDGTCYLAGAQHPEGCAECDPATSTSAWTVSGNACLIDAVCRAPGEVDATDCNECDPAADKYGWTPLADVCKIAGRCFQPGDQHSAGCATCQPTDDPAGWTVTANHCLIANACYDAGDMDGSGCGTCDPASDDHGWTPVAGKCRIFGECYSAGATHPQGCGTCDPAQDPTFWTVPGDHCLIVDTCYSAGATHPAGCGTCDPQKAKTAWTVDAGQCLIGNACHSAGATDVTGCGSCDPTSSQTSWTQTPGCFKIVFTALNEAHTGNLGGVAGADALCMKQAAEAGFSGTFRAFLSSSTQDAKNLVTGTAATSVPVITANGVQLFAAWNKMFNLLFPAWFVPIYTFDGTKVGNTNWDGGNGWTGTLKSGLLNAGKTCDDWTSNSATAVGCVADIESGLWPTDWSGGMSCDSSVAVMCVQVGP